MKADERRWKGRKSDSGWITLASSVTGSWGVQYRVLDGVVYVVVSGSVSTPNNSTTTYTSAQLPAELRPPVAVRSGGFFTSAAGVVSVTTGGDVTGFQASGGGTSTVSGTVSYPVT